MKKVKKVLLYAAVVPLVIVGITLVSVGVLLKAAGFLFVFDTDSTEEEIRTIGS